MKYREHAPLQPARILHPNHDVGQHLLENPQRSKEVARADFPEILVHRFVAFRQATQKPLQ